MTIVGLIETLVCRSFHPKLNKPERTIFILFSFSPLLLTASLDTDVAYFFGAIPRPTSMFPMLSVLVKGVEKGRVVMEQKRNLHYHKRP